MATVIAAGAAPGWIDQDGTAVGQGWFHRFSARTDEVGPEGWPMSTQMRDCEWALVALVFESVLAPQGPKTDNIKFLKALHFFTVHNISWRAMPAEFGRWNSSWRRFDRLSRAGVFEDFFEALADLSETAHPVQMFDATVVRAHVSAAGAKGGGTGRRLVGREAVFQPRST